MKAVIKKFKIYNLVKNDVLIETSNDSINDVRNTSNYNNNHKRTNK